MNKLLGLIFLVFAVVGCGVTHSAEETANQPGWVSVAEDESKLTTPRLGIGYRTFERICGKVPGDDFTRVEDEGVIRAVTTTVYSDARNDKGCVGTFVFEDYRLVRMIHD
jgi:hypothetical protein